MRDMARVLGLLALLTTSWTAGSMADWAASGAAVCTAADRQEASKVVALGSGVTIVVWKDDREGAGSFDQVYAQKLDANGVPQWAPNGVRVSDTRFHHGQPAAVADREGGVFIAYSQSPEPTVDRDLFMQHVDGSGSVLWGNGVNLGGDPEESPPALINDGSNTQVFTPGAIVAWSDFAPGAGEGNIFAQHVDADGNPTWGSGVAVCVVAGNQSEVAMVVDGVSGIFAHGCFIAWIDMRSDKAGDIYAQRLNNAGAPQWEATGRPVCTATFTQNAPALALSSNGSAIIGWGDNRSGSYDVYAQLEGTSGAAWTANGVPVCTAAGNQFPPVIVGDSKGGAILAWQDTRTDGGDIYAQRVNVNGALMWPAPGIGVCTAANVQQTPVILTDITGGAICAWTDRRLGSADDLFAQRVDSSGVTLWNPNGVSVCHATGLQLEPAIAADGAGGAIVSWSDDRAGSANRDIYANLVTAGGGVTSVEPHGITTGSLSVEALPNPAARGTILRFTLPVASSITARMYDVNSRLVRTLFRGQTYDAGASSFRWDGTDDSHRPMPIGMYVVRIEAAGVFATCRVSVVR